MSSSRQRDRNHHHQNHHQSSHHHEEEEDESYNRYDLEDISAILDVDDDDEDDDDVETAGGYESSTQSRRQHRHGNDDDDDNYRSDQERHSRKECSSYKQQQQQKEVAESEKGQHRRRRQPQYYVDDDDSGGRHPQQQEPREHRLQNHHNHNHQSSHHQEQAERSTPRRRTGTTPTKAKKKKNSPMVVSPAKTEPETDTENDTSAASSASSSSASSDDDDDDDVTNGTNGTSTDDEGDYSTDEEGSTSRRITRRGSPQHHHAHTAGGGGSSSSSVLSSGTKSHKRLLRRLQTDDASLTSVVVDQTLLEHSSIAELAKVLAVNTTVSQLTLDLPRGFKPQHTLALLNALECNDTIGSLSLCHVSICRKVATSLATFFSKSPTLIKLQLKQCPFMESGLAVVFLGLQHCKTLSSLSMDGCNLGEVAVDMVAATVSLLELSSLQLPHTNLSLQGLEFLLQNMERSRKKSRTSSMLYLDLSGNDVVGTKEGMQLLVDALESSSFKLQRLVLQDCGLKRSAIRMLCQDGLTSNNQNDSKLTHLDVSHNRDLDDRAAKYLCKLLSSSPKLVELNVQGCPQISKALRVDLSDKLRYNNSFLKTIGLSSDVSLAILDSMRLLENMTK